MRFLHTGDWHLGRTIGGRSRIDESARVLDEVAGIAIDEGVDAILIAGDTFDAFSPPSEAQKLLYETLSRIVRQGIKVVMIAGNHDSAPRMDALADILELAGVHAIGSLPDDADYRAVRVASRDGSEASTVVAVPWISERLAVKYETLFGESNKAYEQYAANIEKALRFYCTQFAADTVNVLLGHMFVGGTVIGEGSGERPLHIGKIFAVPGQVLPATAQYIALGHVHKPQAVPDAPVAGASFYAGSLLQLDFGEAGQQKSVRIVDAKRGLPADSKTVPVTRGTALRKISVRLEDLATLADAYRDDYLWVSVEVDGPVQSLAQQVLAVLPNAIVIPPPVRTDIAQPVSDERKRGLEPHELIARYYTESRGDTIPPELLALFNTMHEEAIGASA